VLAKKVEKNFPLFPNVFRIRPGVPKAGWTNLPAGEAVIRKERKKTKKKDNNWARVSFIDSPPSMEIKVFGRFRPRQPSGWRLGIHSHSIGS
jgi:hypothetical protein